MKPNLPQFIVTSNQVIGQRQSVRGSMEPRLHILKRTFYNKMKGGGIVMVPLIFWMFIQFLVGLWILVSPFVLSRGMISPTANRTITGAIVVLVAIGVAIFNKNMCACEPGEKKSTQRLEQKTS
jgi:hypothetical protein